MLVVVCVIALCEMEQWYNLPQGAESLHLFCLKQAVCLWDDVPRMVCHCGFYRHSGDGESYLIVVCHPGIRQHWSIPNESLWGLVHNQFLTSEGKAT